MMKIAVVGTGLIAHENVPALLRTGRCEIAALCNRTREKAESFAGEYGLKVPIFTDLEELLSQVPCDAVLLNTPHGAHGAQVAACAGAGRHVLVEKPLGVTASECGEMIRQVETHGVRAAVCHTQRYLPLIHAMGDYLRSPEGTALGKLRHAQDCINFTYFHERRPKWFFDPAQAGGGLLLTHGAHQIDRLHWLMGVGESYLTAAHTEYLEQYPGIDSGYQLMGMAGDVSYTVTCGGYPSPHTSFVQLDFERGTLRAELFDNGLCRAGLYLGGDGGYTPLPVAYEDAYRDQFDALLDHLEGKPADVPTFAYAAQVVKVLEQARQLSSRA